MALIRMRNFSHDHITRFNPQPGDVIDLCNFSQMYPHTSITEVAGLTFKLCNLVNCDTPNDAVIEDCNTKQVSRCGHLHDEYDCAVDCEHLISSEDIIIDGVVVDTLYEYADKAVI